MNKKVFSVSVFCIKLKANKPENLVVSPFLLNSHQSDKTGKTSFKLLSKKSDLCL